MLRYGSLSSYMLAGACLASVASFTGCSLKVNSVKVPAVDLTGKTFALSTLEAAGPTVADGVTTTIVKITLNDPEVDLVPGLVPEFRATDTGGTNIYGKCSTSDDKGLSTCTLASRRAELKTLKLTSPVEFTGSTTTFRNGPATHLEFATQPGGGAAAIAWPQQPVVRLLDANENLVTTGADATRAVTVALTTGTGTLSGTATVSAVAGLASFGSSGLSIQTGGTGKILTASATLTSGASTVASQAFTISGGAATQLVFVTQPGGGVAGAAWAQQPVVQIQDVVGNLVTVGADATRVVTLTLTTGTGALAGTLTATAVGGIATFSGLSLNLVGAGKVVTAAATLTSGAVSTASNAFTITHSAASQLVFTTQPSASTVSAIAFAQQPVVTVQDSYGNTVTTGAAAPRLRLPWRFNKARARYQGQPFRPRSRVWRASQDTASA
jgi:hypothetical protein